MRHRAHVAPPPPGGGRDTTRWLLAAALTRRLACTPVMLTSFCAMAVRLSRMGSTPSREASRLSVELVRRPIKPDSLSTGSHSPDTTCRLAVAMPAIMKHHAATATTSSTPCEPGPHRGHASGT